MGAGKTQPLTEQRGDERGAEEGVAGLSVGVTAGGVNTLGRAGLGARQGWRASAPKASGWDRGEEFTNGAKGYIGLDIKMFLFWNREIMKTKMAGNS